MNDDTRTATPADSRSTLLADLLDRLTARAQAGEVLDTAALAAEHPEFAADLRRLVPALGLLGELSRSRAPLGTEPHADFDGTLGDYRIVREVGRGGMGVVYEAEQISLRRRVALKVLPFAAVMDPRQVQRFKNEAVAAAGLDHPHVVKVYGVGFERGIHFIAMQFIEGQTLAELIRERRDGTTAPVAGALDPSRKLPPDATSDEAPAPQAPTRDGSRSRSRVDSPYARRVAEWGFQAAGALEHAHALGVVHRDVKPGNLLVDAQGSVHVADFGLAKSALDPGLTGTGDVLGTVRYMSPEQASSKHDLVDHRSDVYSLGVTLYELLTLTPAFEGGDRQSVLSRVLSDDPTSPRTLDRNIPRDLETVVLKAMAKEPARRYQSAGELAADLQRFLGSMPIRARRPGVLDRVAKWARRHRAAVVAAVVAALVILPVTAGSLGWTLNDRANRRTQAEREEAGRRGEVERRLDAGLAEVETLHARGKWTAAREAVAGLEPLLGAGVSDDQRDRLLGWRADLDMVARLTEIRARRPVTWSDPFSIQTADRAYAAAFREYGIDFDVLASDDAAGRIAARPVRAELAAALDDWAGVRPFVRKTDGEAWRRRLLEIARAADGDGTRSRIRDALLRRDPAALLAVAGDPATAELPPATVCALAEALRDLGERNAAADLLRPAQRLHPQDFWVNAILADVLAHARPERRDEVLRFSLAAVTANPLSPAARLNVGRAFEMVGSYAEVEACYREAIRLKPDFAEAYRALGHVLASSNRRPEAEAAFREAVRLDPRSRHASHDLDSILSGMGRPEEAVARYREAIRLRPDSVGDHHDLGIALQERGNMAEAIICFQHVIRLDPDHVGAHFSLGQRLTQMGKPAEAAASCREVLRMQPGNAHAHCLLGEAYFDLRKTAEAEASFRESIRLDPSEAQAHYGLARVLKTPSAREASLREVLRLRPGHRGAGVALAHILLLSERRTEAEAVCRAVLKVDSSPITESDAMLHSYLGNALHELGRLEEALEARRKARDIDAKINGKASSAMVGAVKESERDIALQAKLPKVLAGVEKLANGDETILAGIAESQGRYADAAKLWVMVFPQHFPLGKLNSARYRSACSMLQVSEAELKNQCRRKALSPLCVELAGWTLVAADPAAAPKVRAAMRNWHEDPALAPIRDETELKKLPESEQVEWRRLWADVAKLQERVAAPPKSKQAP